MAYSRLIDPKLLKKLEQLSLAAPQNLSSLDAGQRRSRRRGLSIEFSDFREYQPGDDLRYVDWKAYGRLEKLFLKLFQDEEDLRLHLILDSSKSMDFGEPVTKWSYSLKAAAAIGFIALHRNNRVDVSSFDTGISTRVSPLRGDAGIQTYLKLLESLKAPAGETDFLSAVRQFTSIVPAAGMVILFSDFFDPSVLDGLRNLAGRRHSVVLVQVLDRQEVEPNGDGDFSLTDAELGTVHEVTLTEFEMAEYSGRLNQQRADLENAAGKYGMEYLQVVSDQPIDELILHSLRSAGVLL